MLQTMESPTTKKPLIKYIPKKELIQSRDNSPKLISGLMKTVNELIKSEGTDNTDGKRLDQL